MVMWAKELDTSRETGVIIVTSRKCPEHRIQLYISEDRRRERGEGEKEAGRIWQELKQPRMSMLFTIDLRFRAYIYTRLFYYHIPYIITDDFSTRHRILSFSLF